MFERIGLFFISYLKHPSTATSFSLLFSFPLFSWVIVFFLLPYPFLSSSSSISSIPCFIKIANFPHSYLLNKQIFIKHNFGANFPAFFAKYKVLFFLSCRLIYSSSFFFASSYSRYIRPLASLMLCPIIINTAPFLHQLFLAYFPSYRAVIRSILVCFRASLCLFHMHNTLSN